VTNLGKRIDGLEDGGDVMRCPHCRGLVELPNAGPVRRTNEDQALLAAEAAYAAVASRTPIPAPFLEADGGE
jgi:hypothetical protein